MRPAPSTATARGSCSRSRTARSVRSVRSPTISRSTAGYERAVEACLGDLLQHVVVRTHDQAAAGLRFASRAQCRAASASWSRRAAPAVAAPAGVDSGAIAVRQLVQVQARAKQRSRRASPTRGLPKPRSRRGRPPAWSTARSPRWTASSSAGRTGSKAALAPKRGAFSRPSARSRSCASGLDVERAHRRSAARGDRRARRRSRGRGIGHRLGAGRAAPSGEGRSSRSSCRRGPRDSRRAAHPQAGSDRDRAADRGRGAARAGSPAGGSPRVHHPHRRGAARRRRPAEPCAAPPVRGARGDAGAGAGAPPKRRRRTPRWPSVPRR